MYFVLMISSCCAIGDCFSCNKKRLPSVALLVAEFDVLCEADFDDHSGDYDSRKARKVNLYPAAIRDCTDNVAAGQFFDLTFFCHNF